MVKKMTSFVQNEQLKMQQHFTEMLTATISHDMRTPLNAIIGIIRILEPCITSKDGQKYIQIISNSSQILLYLVSDLLDLFKLRNGKFSKNEHEAKILIVV